MKLHTTLFFAAIIMAGCAHNNSNPTGKQSSSGKTQEVILAIDKHYYVGEAQHVLDSLLRTTQEGLPQPEPLFSVVVIPTSSLKNTQMFQMQRNIVFCDIDTANAGKLYIHRDQWAAPQVVIDIAAKSPADLQRLVRLHAQRIVDELFNAEHRRIEKAFYANRNTELMSEMRHQLGFQLTLPNDFQVAKKDDGLMWVRKETKDFSLNILMHTEPYKEQRQFASTRVLNRYDTLMRRNMPGPIEGSYLGTERRLDIQQRIVNVKESAHSLESRGLWRTFGDFNGGSFVAYSLLSPDKRTVADIIAMVYCPRSDKYSKRDLLMQLEGICHSITWNN